MPALAEVSRPLSLDLRETPIGFGNPVIFIPGFVEADRAMRRAVNALRNGGYRNVSDSHLLLNTGLAQNDLLVTRRHLRAETDRTGKKAVLIGHSLGGKYARKLALQNPDEVARIITCASLPVSPSSPPLEEGIDEIHLLAKLDTVIPFPLHLGLCDSEHNEHRILFGDHFGFMQYGHVHKAIAEALAA